MNENELAKIVVELSLKIHRTLGPGLLESVYDEVLSYELARSGLKFSRQHGIVVVYESIKMDFGVWCLRLTNKKLGLLVNFNVELIKDGIKRIVNNL